MSLKKALKQYEDFHKYDAKNVGEFPSSFSIPESALLAGRAEHVLYRSSKYDPVTYEKPKKPIDYIHEHKDGVKVYRCDRGFNGPERTVPKYICEAEVLVKLGKCLGFAYEDENGDIVEAECTGNIDLYAIPSGKALLVIENKKKVLALIWGGKLRVEPRGIVG